MDQLESVKATSNEAGLKLRASSSAKLIRVSGTALERKSISFCSIGRTILPSRPAPRQGASRGGKVKAGRLRPPRRRRGLGLTERARRKTAVGRVKRHGAALLFCARADRPC